MRVSLSLPFSRGILEEVRPAYSKSQVKILGFIKETDVLWSELIPANSRQWLDERRLLGIQNSTFKPL